MEFRELEAFVAVADELHFGRAAERLHLSQPAVSKRVQALEAHLDCRLFDRIGRRVWLTDAGRLLLPRAALLQRTLLDTERQIREMDRQVAGVLGLATSHHVGLHRLAAPLKRFVQDYPDVQLDIRFEDSEAAHDLVRRAETEIAVVTLNPRGDPDLQTHELWVDPLEFVVAAEHELAAGETVSLQRLAQARPVLPGAATYTGRIVLEAFADAGITLRPALATNYLETITMLAGIGLGWSVLPRSMIRPPLVVLKTDCPPLSRSLGYVVDPRRTPSNAARAFQSVLRRYAGPPGT